ncbi:hypothetical protein BDF22DRAFT_652836 [Syncephalis plumigaleata]|nr:hypothetical protein BDF22DRAFT_652836 [Syncephalis plumigaleata]
MDKSISTPRPISASSISGHIISDGDNQHASYEVEIVHNRPDDCFTTRYRRLQKEFNGLSELLARTEEERDTLKAELQHSQEINTRMAQESQKRENDLKDNKERLHQVYTDYVQVASVLDETRKTNAEESNILRQTQCELAATQKYVRLLESERHDWHDVRSGMEKRLKVLGSTVDELENERRDYMTNGNQWQTSFLALINWLSEYDLLIMGDDENGRQVIRINKERLAITGDAYSHENNDNGVQFINDASPVFCTFTSPGNPGIKDEHEGYNGKYTSCTYI